MRGLASNEQQLTEEIAKKLAEREELLVTEELVHNPATPLSVLKLIKEQAENGKFNRQSEEMVKKTKKAIEEKTGNSE